MATQKQIEANRLNAQKSTGPRTPEGKATVRLNALQNGLRARTLILPGENEEEFQQLCADLEAEWQPRTRTARLYLEQMAVAQWKLRRIEAAERDLLTQSLPAAVQIPLLDRLWQAQNRFERSFARAQRDLERIQAPPRSQAPRPEPDPPSPPRPTLAWPLPDSRPAPAPGLVCARPAASSAPGSPPETSATRRTSF
jgi:hypothetical protein